MTESDAERAKRWQCAKCLKVFPVPSMARECELKHQQKEIKVA